MNYTSLKAGKCEELFTKGGDFTLSLARYLSRSIDPHGLAAQLERDDLEHRVQVLESQIGERDESIRSLNTRLNDPKRLHDDFLRSQSRTKIY